MNLSKFIRSHDWWDYKMLPILTVAYATLLLGEKNIFDYASHISLILISVIIGAVYVSFINDISDIDIDIKAGKNNKMASLPLLMKWALPLACLTIGIGFIYFYYYPDWISCVFYTMPWILFSMYSFPPFRLKNRGLPGILADAGGAHVFISLLMISSLSYTTGQPINYQWSTAVGVWATCSGLRGILWHQFTDRDNDIRTGIKTFATELSPNSLKKAEWWILAIELMALFYMLYMLSIPLTYLAFAIYAVLMLLRYKKLNITPISILHKNERYQILLLDFTDLFLPLSLLIYASFTQTNALVILILQFLLFPGRWIEIAKDIYRIIRPRKAS